MFIVENHGEKKENLMRIRSRKRYKKGLGKCIESKLFLLGNYTKVSINLLDWIFLLFNLEQLVYNDKDKWENIIEIGYSHRYGSWKHNLIIGLTIECLLSSQSSSPTTFPHLFCSYTFSFPVLQMLYNYSHLWALAVCLKNCNCIIKISISSFSEFIYQIKCHLLGDIFFDYSS